MKCPNCDYEPRHRLLSRPCPSCGHIWYDSCDYVRLVTEGFKESIQTTLDVGSGLKGIIAEAYWRELGIKQGFACDRHVIKELAPPFTPLLCDAETLTRNKAIISANGVDVTTSFGALEHMDYVKALRVLAVLELITKRAVIISCSAVLRDVDYKVKRDGNPYHYYKSWWDAATLEALGYTVDRGRPQQGQTFTAEVIAWRTAAADGRPLREAFPARAERALAVIAARRCCQDGCDCEPVAWNAAQAGNNYYCVRHFIEWCEADNAANKRVGDSDSRINDVRPWLSRADAAEQIVAAAPNWRAPLRGI